MTKTREAEQEASFWGYDAPKHKAKGDEAVPLHYLTAAYRRKHVVDAIMDPKLREEYAGTPGAANRLTKLCMPGYAINPLLADATPSCLPPLSVTLVRPSRSKTGVMVWQLVCLHSNHVSIMVSSVCCCYAVL